MLWPAAPSRFATCLKTNQRSSCFELEISAQKALLAKVRRLLPDDLATHCAAAQLHGPQLVLHTDSPSGLPACAILRHKC